MIVFDTTVLTPAGEKYAELHELILKAENEDKARELAGQWIDYQIENGITPVCTGGIRWNKPKREFYFGLDGITREYVTEGHVYQEVETFTNLIRIINRIGFNPVNPVTEEFSWLRDYVGDRAECAQVLPSPSNLYLTIREYHCETSKTEYPDLSKLVEDIVATYTAAATYLAEQGCKHIRFYDRATATLADPDFAKRYLLAGIDPETVRSEATHVLSEVMSALPHSITASVSEKYF